MSAVNGFTTRQVCKITGIEYSTLDYWDRAGFIKPSIAEGAGTGSRRLYSFRDLISIKVANSLRSNGVSLQKLRKVVDYLKQQDDRITHPLAGTILITDGKKVYLTNDETTVVDILAGGQLVFALALDKLVNKLEKRTKMVARDVA